MSNERTGVLELTLGDSYIGSAYSPQVEVTDTDTGHEVAITYMSPEGIVTERFDVADGEQGPQGPAGYSPTVTITDTPTGHTVTITDEDGPHSYDVPNYAQEEQQRQTAWDALSGDVTDAITAAESATSAASTAAQSATGAASSATSAAQAANTAASSATTAASSANAAATAANSAATAAGTAADEATTAAGDATDAASAANTAAEAAQEAAKGISGAADALMGDPSESTWVTRTSTGSGMARVESVQGAAVTWNQHVSDANALWSAFNGAKSYSDGVVTVTPNGGDSFQYCAASQNMDISGIGGHKYFVSVDLLKEDWSDTAQTSNYAFPTLFGSWLNQYVSLVPSKSVTTWQHLSGIVSQASDNPSNTFTFRSYGSTYPFSIKNVMVIDLTQMFGAGNEPATVAEFEAMYPEAYYPYSAPTLKPVQIAGIASTDAQGSELDSVEWTTFTLRGAGTIGDMLYSDHVETRVGVVDLGTLTWGYNSQWECFAGNIGAVAPTAKQAFKGECAKYPFVGGYQNLTDKSCGYIYDTYAAVMDTDYGTDTVAFKAAMSGVMLYYELATPTTTPISPALPMSYKVEQGGTESIIVPTGEVSATPMLTVAEGESAADLVMDALACIAAPDGPVATSSHAINTYLTMQGKLYKVTTAIAVGETIAAGTNVTATTVMAELIARTA